MNFARKEMLPLRLFAAFLSVLSGAPVPLSQFLPNEVKMKKRNGVSARELEWEIPEFEP